MNNKLKDIEDKLPKNCCSFCQHMSLEGPREDYSYDVKCIILDALPDLNGSCRYFSPEYTRLNTSDLDDLYISFLETCLRVNYDDYLNSIYWKLFKEKVLDDCNHKCCICGSRDNVDVYHLKKNLGRESPNDVIVMCSDCLPR